MSDPDHVLGLLDDLMRLAAGTPAVTIEVEADGFAVSLTRQPGAVADAAFGASDALGEAQAGERTQRVHATTVGVFSAAREWTTGAAVTRGEVLGGIQSLGHVAEIVAPADGAIREILVAAGAPVEYGQPLFVIDLA